MKPYEYQDAATLLADFWTAVYAVLRKRGYGLVRLERGERGRITPKVEHDRVELDLPLIRSENPVGRREAV